MGALVFGHLTDRLGRKRLFLVSLGLYLVATVATGLTWSAAFGAALSGVLLDEALFGADVGWRLAFFLGAALAVAIMLVRRHVPESPRWMMIHDRTTRRNDWSTDRGRGRRPRRPEARRGG